MNKADTFVMATLRELFFFGGEFLMNLLTAKKKKLKFKLNKCNNLLKKCLFF